MTDTIVQFEAGDVLANLEERTISGLLLPYNEEGRTNIGRFQVQASAVRIPEDPTVVGLNIGHERTETVGRAVKLEEKPGGIFATFKIAATPEGDAALAAAHDGTRRKLSAEFGPSFIKAGKLVAGHAKLWGAALVEAGAFPSAQVLAADTPDPEQNPAAPDEPTETTETFSEEFTDEAGVTRKRTTTRTTRTEPDGEGGTKTTITEKTVIEEPDPEQEPATQEEEPAVSVPNTLAAKAAPKVAPKPVDLRNVYAAMADFKANPHDESARQVLAALSDIKISGSGSLPVGGGAIRENWVGPVWQGKTYQRKYIGLCKLGTDITAGGKKGFKVGRGTSGSPVDQLGGDWTGNKTDIPSGGGFTSSVSSTLARFAWGADIAREYIDLPGGAEVLEAFVRLIVEDYAVWSDEKALGTIVATAGTAVAPGTYPTQFSGALGQLIQGILAVEAAKDTPSYAIVNQTAYQQLVYTPKDLIPEFVNFTFGTEGTGTADGRVQVVAAPDSAFTGLEAATPATIVGARNAIEFDELGETPIQIDALEIAKGGVDRAMHGYLQTFVVRPEAVVLVGTVDTP